MTESIANLVVHGFDVHPLVETFRRDRVMHDKFKETLDQIAERILDVYKRQVQSGSSAA